MERKRVRLDALDRVEMPVSWRDVEFRRPDPSGPIVDRSDRPSPRARLVAAVIAFAVFVPVAVFGWMAWRSPSETSVGIGEAPTAVLTLSETGPDGDFPSATLSFDGQTQQGQIGSGSWKGAIFDVSTPELTGFVRIPEGTELIVEGTAGSVQGELGQAEPYPFERLARLDLSSGRAVLDAAPGRYALTIDATWPDGELPFSFGIEIVSRAEDEIFFPTWETDALPQALVTTTLIERDGCLFAYAAESEALILWERGLSYADGAVTDAGGAVVARVDEAFHGAGGWYARSARTSVEDLVGEPVPDRCVPEHADDAFVLVYDVAPGLGTGGSETPSIEVTTPIAGENVTTPVTIAGAANVFEGTVRIRIFDAINNMIVDTYTTTSCGSGCMGQFSAAVDFAVSEEQPGEIVVFEEDAETGRPTNTVRIPVTLLPGGNVEAAQEFVGTWTDANGDPVTEDVLSASLGPEHCSWGDIVFLHVSRGSDPVGAAYVRDTTAELAGLSVKEWGLSDPPAQSVSSGFRVGEWELVFDEQDDRYIYLHNATTGVTERWPRLQEDIACA